MLLMSRPSGQSLHRSATCSAVSDPAAQSASAVVLLVEDELALRMVIVEMLSDLGYTVLEAGNSQSGLQIVESGARIDLL